MSEYLEPRCATTLTQITREKKLVKQGWTRKFAWKPVEIAIAEKIWFKHYFRRRVFHKARAPRSVYDAANDPWVWQNHYYWVYSLKLKSGQA